MGCKKAHRARVLAADSSLAQTTGQRHQITLKADKRQHHQHFNDRVSVSSASCVTDRTSPTYATMPTRRRPSVCGRVAEVSRILKKLDPQSVRRNCCGTVTTENCKMVQQHCLVLISLDTYIHCRAS